MSSAPSGVSKRPCEKVPEIRNALQKRKKGNIVEGKSLTDLIDFVGCKSSYLGEVGCLREFEKQPNSVINAKLASSCTYTKASSPQKKILQSLSDLVHIELLLDVSDSTGLSKIREKLKSISQSVNVSKSANANSPRPQTNDVNALKNEIKSLRNILYKSIRFEVKTSAPEIESGEPLVYNYEPDDVTRRISIPNVRIENDVMYYDAKNVRIPLGN